MAADEPQPGKPVEPISKREFDKRDEALTEALDKLEKETSPPKTKPAPIGSMF